MGDRVFRDETDAETSRDQGLDPVLALAAVDLAGLEATRIAGFTQEIPILAVHAQQIVFAGDLVDLDRILVGKTVPDRKGNHESFLIKRPCIEARVEGSRLRHDGNVEFSLHQHFGEANRYGFHQRELDTWILQPELVEDADEAQRTDRAHYSHSQRRIAQLEKVERRATRVFRLLQNLLQMRQDQPAEIGQMGELPFAPEQEAAHLFLEFLDGPGQGRLAHIAALGGAGEIQCIANSQEIADLVNLHAFQPSVSSLNRMETFLRWSPCPPLSPPEQENPTIRCGT